MRWYVFLSVSCAGVGKYLGLRATYTILVNWHGLGQHLGSSPPVTRQNSQCWMGSGAVVFRAGGAGKAGITEWGAGSDLVPGTSTGVVSGHKEWGGGQSGLSPALQQRRELHTGLLRGGGL